MSNFSLTLAALSTAFALGVGIVLHHNFEASERLPDTPYVEKYFEVEGMRCAVIRWGLNLTGKGRGRLDITCDWSGVSDG